MTALGLGVPPAEAAAGCAGEPWMDTHRSPDERATLLVARMTLDEKVQEMQRATALPAPIGQAATFDPAAARRYGAIEGVETGSVPAPPRRTSRSPRHST